MKLSTSHSGPRSAAVVGTNTNSVLPGLVLFLGLSAATNSNAQECDSPKTLTCQPTTVLPMLDADLSDWSDVEGIASSLISAKGLLEYGSGKSTFKCLYSDTHIYFALEFPGAFRFDSTDNHQCAAIGTMLKIGEEATFVDMGGCPDAIDSCNTVPNAVPESCESYRVDIGAHWELSGTEQGVTYGINVDDVTGDDPVANKDDEYAVSPYCRFDDDDDDAGNEWAGAWVHSSQGETSTTKSGETGSYKFELSRLLTTASAKTDAQLTAGETYQFGIAYWDPFETDAGWIEEGHYVTGCAKEWMDLVLADGSASAPTASPTSAAYHFFGRNGMMVMVVVGAIVSIF
jgi:hypothetical protein